MEKRTESEVLNQLQSWAQDEACVRAALLTGSRANPKGQVDFLSDYDVVLYVTDWKPFQESDNWLQRFGEVLLRWPMVPRSTFANDWLTRLVVFEDGVRIDFQITESCQIELHDYDNGYRVLVDKEDMTRFLKAPTYTVFNIKKPSNDEFEELINEFWWDATYVPKQLWRNELPFAKYMLDSLLRCNYLHQLIGWYIGAQYDWAVNPGVHGKWFSRYLDRATWDAYKASFAGAEIEDNWHAFFRLCDLFGRLAADTAEQLGYSYPSIIEKKVIDYAIELKQQEGD